MRIRLYKRDDLDDIMKLYYNAVHNINAQDYSDDELDVMAPQTADRYHWEASLAKNHTIVAEGDEGLLGFGNIGSTRFLDCLYVDVDHLHEGVAEAMLKHLENYAKAKGNHIINVYSPITAQAFFEKHGYALIEEAISEHKGVRILKYLMEKKF